MTKLDSRPAEPETVPSPDTSDTAASGAPAPTSTLAENTAAGETSHKNPRIAGRTTAAMWLMVNDTPALEAISAGSAIFWK